jgi:hypothetical protein
MGYFSDLKFGGGSIGLFDNSKLPAGALLDLAKGDFRTNGSFAPGSTSKLFKIGGTKPNTNKPADWAPTILLKPLTVTTKAGATKRYQPGFLPPAFLSKQILDKKIGKGKINEYSWNEDNAWIGHLLNSHLESDYYNQFTKNFVSIDTKQRLEEATKPITESEAYSARDYYLRFNDQGTDYFRHGLHIDGYTNLKSGKDSREAWDGSGDPFRLASFTNTSYENNDPVTYGFELVIDAFSSPLLNGAVEDFITQFSYISEIASKAIVVDDFKRQFEKIFRTKGSIKTMSYSADDVLINKQREGQSMASNSSGLLHTYAGTETQTNLYRPGKKAYMSYYLQKIDGLSKLIESNTPDAQKYLTDYGKDVIKLTFLEDVSATMGTLAHLYKLLYWSKPNGKNLIPENLLRFNCDIIVSECRNFNRVRKAAKTGDLEIIKDNVSRYIYQLRECQFYFNTMPHEDAIDMGGIKTYGDGAGAYEVTFDYKYSSTKFEKWVPDAEKFGQYVGYHNGALWKIGNKGMRDVRKDAGGFVTIDTSVPKFYTVGTNTMRGNGVTKAIILDAFGTKLETDGEEAKIVLGTSGPDTPTTAPKEPQKSGDSVGEDEEAKGAKKEDKKKKKKEGLDKFKENSKKAGVNLAKGAAKFVFNEVNNQISTRVKLLNDTIDKARNLLGMGGISGEPKRVYPRPYSPHSLGIFFDVRNDLFNFVGDEVAGIIGGAMQSLLPGTQINVPFKMPNIGATLDKLTKGFSLYDAEAKLIASMQSNGPKMPFFDGSKHSTKWAGKSTNKIYNANTTFKFPMTTENVKYGGGFGVLALSYMKPKGNIYSDGNTKPAKMIDSYSKPLNNKFPVGTKDYAQIQFPAGAAKYPTPLIKNNSSLTQIVQAGTIWSFPVNDKKFGK